MFDLGYRNILENSSMGKYLLLCLSLLVLAESLVIYRRKPKPKLICHAEGIDEKAFPAGPTTISSVDIREFTEAAAERGKRDTKNVEAVIDLEVGRFLSPSYTRNDL